MPITEETPQVPLSPYGKSKLAAEEMIIEHKATDPEFSVVILRYFNVIGSDPEGIIGESPRPELAKRFGRISGACFDVATGQREKLLIMGDTHDTPDGTCVRDYIHVVDLVDAHVRGKGLFPLLRQLAKEMGSPAEPFWVASLGVTAGFVCPPLPPTRHSPHRAAIGTMDKAALRIYNVGLGKGYSVKEFVNACRNVTGAAIPVETVPARPGDAAIVYADPAKVSPPAHHQFDTYSTLARHAQ